MKKSILILLCIIFLSIEPILSQKKTGDNLKETTEHGKITKEEKSVTHHSIIVNDKTIKYTATAGFLILKNDVDSAIASMDYFAYTLDNGKDVSARPITFVYNGGPGSSSIWLHMGAFGPKRVVTTDAGYTPPPPYQTVDNEYSLIDKTDLVFIDPVGTGFSKAVGKMKDKDFWSVDKDINSLSNFIKQYVTENNRWNSPKYLIGESYGTTRSAGIVDYLQTNEHMAFNGVVLASLALDLEAIFNTAGNERPYPLFIPSFTAVSWYHNALPNQPKELDPLLQKARQFALGDYNNAITKGNALSDTEKNSIAEKLHEFTGLTTDYIKKSNLRIEEGKYTQELMREHDIVVGRIDARFLGSSFDPLSEVSEYDPLFPSIFPAFTAAFNNYIHNDLNFEVSDEYKILPGNVSAHWKWKHRISSTGQEQLMVNTGIDLAHAMIYNPNLRVIVLQGKYDLATPLLATEYMISHLNIEKKFQSNISIKYYDSGHMMYLHIPDLKKMNSDIKEFIDSTNIK